MTTRAFQKIYTKIDNITKATVTLRAQGVGNDELATVGGKLAQVVKIRKWRTNVSLCCWNFRLSIRELWPLRSSVK